MIRNRMFQRRQDWNAVRRFFTLGEVLAGIVSVKGISQQLTRITMSAPHFRARKMKNLDGIGAEP